DCNMQEGSLRCDANVNLHIHGADGTTIPTPIVELKNMNSFRNVELAIEYEAKRQFSQWQKTGRKLGEAPKQTRGWDADGGRTSFQREKEESSDYRYFPDPDLIPVILTDAEVEASRAALPETPARRRSRFETELGLSAYDAAVIIDQGPELTEYFENAAAVCADGKTAANWVTQDILRDLNASGKSLADFPITAEILGTLLKCITSERITTKSAREVYAALQQQAVDSQSVSASDIDRIIQERQLEIVRDTGAVLAAIDAVIAQKPQIAADVRAGKVQAAGPLIGMVMKQVAGADPKSVREMLIQRIQETG
ncbi:MAG: Asp-tRNA(Asn)/Glu-tRNA(Gln) amidotransferase GatCAB subunit B, partial [Planctomycetaceae bacterium]|nr:Asp-tRNA(Asn)/Glu-tRNA(Gln) amidotransferase GatCAB subunit B [Planctomycetaceae bacterium]